MSYGRYGMKNIGGGTPHDMMGMAYNDPWFAAGALLAQNWNKNYDDRGQKKADAAVTESMKATMSEIEAAQKQASGGLIGMKPQDMIRDGKYQYEMAKQANDQAGMQSAQAYATQGRQLGDSMGADLVGYGAGDTLQSIYEREAKAGGYSVDPKAENIGMGLHTQQKPVELEPGKGLLTGTMEKLGYLKPEEQPVKKGFFQSILDGNYPKAPKGPLTSFMEQGPPQSKTPLQILDEMQAEGKLKIGVADLSKVTGVDFEAKAMALAEQRARARMLDPNFTSDLEQMLRDKGHTPGQIENAMARPREQVKNAQTEDLTSKYLTAMQSGDMQGADILLTKLAQYNPEAAQILAMRSPSNKDAWSRSNAVEDRNAGYVQQEKATEKNFQQRVMLGQINFNNQKEVMQLQHFYNNADYKTKLELNKMYGVGSNNGGMNQQKLLLDQANKEIEAGQKWLETNFDKKIEDYPGFENYQVAQGVKKQFWGIGGTGSSGAGGGYNRSNYYDAMREAGEIISAVKNDPKRKNMPIGSVIGKFKELYGDMADQIINDVDWGAWGYSYKPNQSIPNYQPSTD